MTALEVSEQDLPMSPMTSWRAKLSRRFPSSNRSVRRLSADDVDNVRRNSGGGTRHWRTGVSETYSSGELNNSQSGDSTDRSDPQNGASGPLSQSERRIRSSSSKSRGSRRPRRKQSRHHTIDNTISDVAAHHSPPSPRRDLTLTPSKKPPPSPLSEKRQLSGLLTRFLSSTSRRRSLQHGSGDTCSRLTDDEADLTGGLDPTSNGNVISASQIYTNSSGSGSSPPTANAPGGQPPRFRRPTIDTADSETPPPKRRSPLAKTASTVLASSRVLLQKQGSLLPRRNTLDSLVSNHTRRGSNGSLVGIPQQVEEETVASKQARLQRLADDMHKGGELDMAILVWMELLDLAEENHESLSHKTEIMCILMDLHFQLSQRPEALDDEYDTAWKDQKDNDTPPMRRDPQNSNRQRMTSMSASYSTSSRSFSLDEELPHSPEYHARVARRYVHRIKPAMVKASWIGCSIALMKFLGEADAWELALVVAEKLMKEPGIPQVNPEQLATMHFHVASQKLDSQRQGEALQHLQATVKNLQQVPTAQRDMDMYLQVLQLLATEYQQQGQPALAVEAYLEQMNHAPAEKQAHICCQMAEIYISERQLDLALVELEVAAQKLIGDDQTSNRIIRLQLLQTKGDVYYRLGRMDESMDVYQHALQEAQNPAEKAKLLYTLGRLCIRLRRTREAISFFSRELEITQQELGVNHLSVSRIYHELAKLYDEGLGDHKMALMKYNKALQIELAVLQECHYAVSICQKCNPIAHRMCDVHAHVHTQVTGQIRETKKYQGRMHFKLGDFDKALKTSFNEQASGSSSKRGGRMINHRY